VCTAVHKQLESQLAQGTVLILPLSVAIKVPGIHFSAQHLTENKGKPQGRCLCDVASPANDVNILLNGANSVTKQDLRNVISVEWDPILHPTFTTLMLIILTAVDLYGWDAITLWKKNLKGAFTLLWFRPSDMRLLASSLTDDLVAIVFHLAGIFEWVGMPYIFQVVTRAVVALCAHIILTVSPSVVAAVDIARIDTAVTGLLGPHAIAKSKDEIGRQLDFIG
jgi:hypothetical protein